MGWRIEWSQEAVRAVSKLDQTTAKRIINKLEITLKDPHRYFDRLKGHQDQKLRVGDYRLLATLNPIKRIIFIEALGHRKKIYKQ